MTNSLYGLLAEYSTSEAILHAARQARQAGYTVLDAYTPYPVEGLPEVLGHPRSRIPFIVLVGGLTGAAVGFFMQYWSMVIDYPFNVGGRPLNSWPVFIPITFEVMILLASLGAFFGVLFLNGLPRLHHPLFNVPEFARSTQDRFFLCIEAIDPRFVTEETRQFLTGLAALAVVDVPRIADEPSRAEPTPATAPVVRR